MKIGGDGSACRLTGTSQGWSMHLHPIRVKKTHASHNANWMVCHYGPVAHRLIGGPSRSLYFYNNAMLVRFCPSPEPVTNWEATFAHPDVLNRTVRGHSIVSRSQGDSITLQSRFLWD